MWLLCYITLRQVFQNSIHWILVKTWFWSRMPVHISQPLHFTFHVLLMIKPSLFLGFCYPRICCRCCWSMVWILVTTTPEVQWLRIRPFFILISLRRLESEFQDVSEFISTNYISFYSSKESYILCNVNPVKHFLKCICLNFVAQF